MYRNLLLTLHIAGVSGWLGANLVQFVLAPRLGRGVGPTSASWWSAAAFLAKKYYTYVAVLIALTGILLVIEVDYEFSHPFISLGFLTIIVGGGLAGAQFGPLFRKAAAAAEAGDAETVAATAKRTTLLAVVDTALVLVTVLAMVAKWGFNP